jgi:hypothetical protein
MKVKYEFDLADENDRAEYETTLKAGNMARAISLFLQHVRSASKHGNVSEFRRFQYKELVEAEIPNDDQLVNSLEMARDFLLEALADDYQY